MEFLAELGVFSGKVIVLSAATGVLLILFFGLLMRARQTKQLLSVENLNERYNDMSEALKETIYDAKALKA
ncbi:MAG TPA: hypothetical protein PKC28_02950, partial [Bdellovibrionales bacterium]|nr:hypothetical protein [Bdellovibrionales bacterium]